MEFKLFVTSFDHQQSSLGLFNFPFTCDNQSIGFVIKCLSQICALKITIYCKIYLNTNIFWLQKLCLGLLSLCCNKLNKFLEKSVVLVMAALMMD